MTWVGSVRLLRASLGKMPLTQTMLGMKALHPTGLSLRTGRTCRLTLSAQLNWYSSLRCYLAR